MGSILSQSGKERCIRTGGSADGKAHEAFDPLGIFDVYLQFGSVGGYGYCAVERGGIAAYQLPCAVHNHLRRVHLVEGETKRILALPLVDGVERKGIAPTEVIPVGDVFAEHESLRAGDELRCVQPGQKCVSRRAVGAAFRGEEFDEDWLAVSGRRSWRGLGVCVR